MVSTNMIYLGLTYSTHIRLEVKTARSGMAINKTSRSGTAINKTATRQDGNNLNSDTATVKMATFANGNGDILARISSL